jgi:hypothetical protein
MEFKGIKGKWSFEQEYDNKYKQETFVISSKDANIDTFVSVWSGNFNGIEEARANALLISKAPEMLSMLQRIYSSWYTSEPDEDLPIQEIQQLIKEATEL